MGFFPTGSSSPPLCICLSFFLSLFVSYSLTVIKMNVSKSQKSSRDAGEQNGAGEPLCTLMETLVLCIPPVPKGQPCLFHSICAVLSHMHTQVNTKRKKKRKDILFSLRGRDLETAAVNGRKTMKHFRPPVKRRCQAAGAWRSYPLVVAGRGEVEGKGLWGLW